MAISPNIMQALKSLQGGLNADAQRRAAPPPSPGFDLGGFFSGIGTGLMEFMRGRGTSNSLSDTIRRQQGLGRGASVGYGSSDSYVPSIRGVPVNQLQNDYYDPTAPWTPQVGGANFDRSGPGSGIYQPGISWAGTGPVSQGGGQMGPPAPSGYGGGGLLGIQGIDFGGMANYGRGAYTGGGNEGRLTGQGLFSGQPSTNYGGPGGGGYGGGLSVGPQGWGEADLLSYLYSQYPFSDSEGGDVTRSQTQWR